MTATNRPKSFDLPFDGFNQLTITAENQKQQKIKYEDSILIILGKRYPLFENASDVLFVVISISQLFQNAVDFMKDGLSQWWKRMINSCNCDLKDDSNSVIGLLNVDNNCLDYKQSYFIQKISNLFCSKNNNVSISCVLKNRYKTYGINQFEYIIIT